MKNIWKTGTLFFISQLIGTLTFGQVVATIEVLAGRQDRLNTIVSASIETVTLEPSSALRLVEISKRKRITTPIQISQDAHGRKIWWMMKGETKAGTKRTYELIKTGAAPAGDVIKTVFTDSIVAIYLRENPVLHYYHKTCYPPAGVDQIYKRSGFIHPLFSPAGAILTNIQPKDHYHHYGIWNPWTKTAFEGDTIDFWNLRERQGTVRFNGFSTIYSGPVYGGFKLIHEHVVVKSQPEKVALNEEIDVVVWDQPADQKHLHLWDFTSTLSCATSSPITLKEYRYGGFGFRATEEWTNKNSKILTSEGLDRKDADGSLARWILVSGETSKGTAGILFMSYPTNYNFPEPLRVWPINANNNRGDVFINFSPTKNKDWHLEPGKKYVLKYRMVVFDGELSASEADRFWQDFANPPVVQVRRLGT
jgi:hypothetical protein